MAGVRGFQFYLDPEQLDRLRTLAEHTGRPMASYVREGIDLALAIADVADPDHGVAGIRDARARMQAVPRLVQPEPPPRYDDVFVQGTMALDGDE